MRQRGLADITTLVPNPRNPNRHPDKQSELLAKIIHNQGWRAPITVSTRSGFIVRGHGRMADATFTDPPYNVDYTGGTEEALKIANDNMSGAIFSAFLLKQCIV